MGLWMSSGEHKCIAGHSEKGGRGVRQEQFFPQRERRWRGWSACGWAWASGLFVGGLACGAGWMRHGAALRRRRRGVCGGVDLPRSVADRHGLSDAVQRTLAALLSNGRP